MRYLQEFENNNTEKDSDNAFSDNSNGCTYHSGRIPNNDNTYEKAENTADNSTEKSENADPQTGNPQNNANTNGYSRPYNANQYPYGQQNRQYTTNGQPPIGDNYSYAAPNNSSRHGAAGREKKNNTGFTALIVILGITLIIAIAGVVAVFIPSKSNGDKTEPNNGVTNAASVTINTDGPTMSVAVPSSANSSNNNSDGLSAKEVYKKIKDSSVGVMIYSAQSGKLVSEGTGVILGEDEHARHTYIITCAHVINADNINCKIMLLDETVVAADIVGYDTRTDIGVLKISKTGLKKAEFVSTENIEVGQQVYAIGNPGGSEFAGSFTNGIVSAIARPIASPVGYKTKCIQHTAAINPGNSGGALINEYGQVIGINTMKIVETEYEGMGFAVPSDIIEDTVNTLIEYGCIPNRAKLGITYRAATSYENYNMIVQLKDLPKGSIVIESISEDSDLANTDVEPGDILIAVNGKKLDNTDILPSMLENAEIGQKITLTMIHVTNDYKLKEYTVSVKLVPEQSSKTAEADS